MAQKLPPNLDELSVTVAVRHDRMLQVRFRQLISNRAFYRALEWVCVSHVVATQIAWEKGTPWPKRIIVCDKLTMPQRVGAVLKSMKRGDCVVVTHGDHRYKCRYCEGHKEAYKAKLRKARAKRAQKKEAARAQADSV